MTGSTLTRTRPHRKWPSNSRSRAAELAEAEERAFRKLVQNVRLPGFRKGKVPRKIFEQTYGSEAVTSRAMDEVVPEVYAKAVREHELEPVESPKLEVLEETDGRPTRVKATVEVRPEIALARLQGRRGRRARRSRSATRTSNAASRRSRGSGRRWFRSSGPPGSATSSRSTTKGTIDGAPFEGGRREGEIAELDEGRFIPGFAAGIVGMTAGRDARQVEAHFPEGYPAAELAGKTATFTITLTSSRSWSCRALDDAFAAQISENATLEQLRDDLRRRLEAVAVGRGRRAVG